MSPQSSKEKKFLQIFSRKSGPRSKEIDWLHKEKFSLKLMMAISMVKIRRTKLKNPSTEGFLFGSESR